MNQDERPGGSSGRRVVDWAAVQAMTGLTDEQIAAHRQRLAFKAPNPATDPKGYEAYLRAGQEAEDERQQEMTDRSPWVKELKKP